jgi:uncharacterized integral membrane protein
MALVGWLVVPAVLVLAVAFVTRRVLRGRDVPSAGRVGALALAAGMLLAMLVAIVVVVNLDSYEYDCDESTSRWPLQLLYALTLLLGGVAIGGVAADKTRVGRLLARHVLVAGAAVVVTLVLLVEVIFVGLSCYGR